MTIEVIRDFFLWSTIINYGVLLLWFFLFIPGHDWMFRLHSKWFRLSAEQFDMIHYSTMAIYKIGIILFNLIPFIALSIVT